MLNHIHLVAVPEQPDSLAICLRRTHGRHAQYLKARRLRRGRPRRPTLPRLSRVLRGVLQELHQPFKFISPLLSR